MHLLIFSTKSIKLVPSCVPGTKKIRPLERIWPAFGKAETQNTFANEGCQSQL